MLCLVWLVLMCCLFALQQLAVTVMSKRFREAFIANVKPTKRFRGDDEESRADEDQEEPGALRKFLTNKRMIEMLENKGIKALFPIQYKTYDAIFAGKDVKAKDKTGSGKTLAFSLPIIERFRKEMIFKSGKNPKFLIMLPTRQLVLQVVTNIDGLKLAEDEFSVLGVYGGEPITAQKLRLERGVDIVVATPGRLIDMINRKYIILADIKVTCLDEADEMLKQGFQENIETIFAQIRAKGAKTQNLLFSATFPEWVNILSAKYQSMDTLMMDLVSKEAEMPSTITHYLLPNECDTPGTIRKLIAHFISNSGKTIIFCETKRQVAELCGSLGNGCAMLHGDVRQCDRERIYREFKTGKIVTIVATNVAARGLDFPDIQLVIQTEPPREIESFIHRSGRTGRAGKSGVNVLMHSFKQKYTLEKIKASSKINFRRLTMEDLKKKK